MNIKYFLNHKTITAVVFIIIALTSCKKSQDDTCHSSLPVKEVINYPLGKKIEYKFVLLPDGRIDSIITTFDKSKFIYNGNTITRISNDLNNKPISKTEVLYNSQGSTTKMNFIGYNLRGIEDPASVQTTTYEYDGVQLVKAITTYALDLNTEVNTYQWKNGNMISSTKESKGEKNTILYWYYEDKPYQPCDGFFLYNYHIFGNAAFTIKNKNLLKGNGVPGLGPDRNIIYSFDNNERITSQAETFGNDTTNTTFEYSCN